MNDFDPGEGWREIDATGYLRADEDGRRVLCDSEGPRYWVRVEPVPPLPTEPYTVIRIFAPSIPERGRVMTLLPMADMNLWVTTEGHHYGMGDITGFEVLAAPSSRSAAEWASMEADFNDLAQRVRRETAEAVLDRVHDKLTPSSQYVDGMLDGVAREFGVAQ